MGEGCLVLDLIDTWSTFVYFQTDLALYSGTLVSWLYISAHALSLSLSISHTHCLEVELWSHVSSEKLFTFKTGVYANETTDERNKQTQLKAVMSGGCITVTIQSYIICVAFIDTLENIVA